MPGRVTTKPTAQRKHVSAQSRDGRATRTECVRTVGMHAGLATQWITADAERASRACPSVETADAAAGDAGRTARGGACPRMLKAVCKYGRRLTEANTSMC